jgi:XTP/dITP diphosphohydrolase
MLIATTNAGKVREFRDLLGSSRFAWEDLSSRPLAAANGVEETGRTFTDNACLKASAYARMFSTWTLADDSGLAVDALEGAPGIHSARWAQRAGAGSGDKANNALLLAQMRDVPAEKRTARFICVLALADPRGRIVLTSRDSIEGRLLDQERGQGGFGYDPLFFVEAVGCTLSQLPAAAKHQISHRGKALRHLRQLLDALQPLPDM